MEHETVIVVTPLELDSVGGQAPELGLQKVVVEADEVNKLENEEVEKCVDACVIDVKCGDRKECGEKWVEEKMCRICHLDSDQTEVATTLIQLGCGCKDDLGVAHVHCAQAWFKLKGNRTCEICGEAAKNVIGIANNRFIEEWNENSTTETEPNPSREAGCWRRQSFCNFLLACLVIAFVLPWFSRINMF